MNDGSARFTEFNTNTAQSRTCSVTGGLPVWPGLVESPNADEVILFGGRAAGTQPTALAQNYHQRVALNWGGTATLTSRALGGNRTGFVMAWNPTDSFWWVYGGFISDGAAAQVATDNLQFDNTNWANLPSSGTVTNPADLKTVCVSYNPNPAMGVTPGGAAFAMIPGGAFRFQNWVNPTTGAPPTTTGVVSSTGIPTTTGAVSTTPTGSNSEGSGASKVAGAVAVTAAAVLLLSA
jgi:hypothetical protein